MTIAANTQIGPDGNRFQPGVDWPIESQIGGAAEQLDVLEDSNIQWHRQPVADMLTGTGMKNGGSLLTGAGFIIPPSRPITNNDLSPRNIPMLTASP